MSSSLLCKNEDKRLHFMDGSVNNVFTIVGVEAYIGSHGNTRLGCKDKSQTITNIKLMVGVIATDTQMLWPIKFKTGTFSHQAIKEKCVQMRKFIGSSRATFASTSIDPATHCLELNLVCVHVHSNELHYFPVSTLLTDKEEVVLIWHNTICEYIDTILDQFFK